MLSTILLVVLILWLVGGLGNFGGRGPYLGMGYGWGGGGGGLILVIVILLIVFGRI